MSSLTQLSQAIHDAPRWHIQDQLQSPEEITIQPLENQALGAVVYGLDARKAQAGETIFKLKQALAQHLILIFKKQSLDDLQLLAFSSYFGAIFRPSADNPVLGSAEDTGTPPDVVPVSNGVGKGDYTGLAHMQIINGHRHLLLVHYYMRLNYPRMEEEPLGITPLKRMMHWSKT